MLFIAFPSDWLEHFKSTWVFGFNVQGFKLQSTLLGWFQCWTWAHWGHQEIDGGRGVAPERPYSTQWDLIELCWQCSQITSSSFPTFQTLNLASPHLGTGLTTHRLFCKRLILSVLRLVSLPDAVVNWSHEMKGEREELSVATALSMRFPLQFSICSFCTPSTHLPLPPILEAGEWNDYIDRFSSQKGTPSSRENLAT